MTDLLQRILPTVQKPARYTGGEYNEIQKDPAQVRVDVAFCFPDTYEIGMSNVGMRILYGVMNEMDGVWCQRVFAPWGDMEEAMRRHDIPLWALESGKAVKDFDMIAFTIGYEMCYTNILNMLNLAGVPLYARERKGLNQMVFAGGVCTFNPEPLADFIDFFSLGEGEESTVEIVSLYDRAKAEGWSKETFLLEVSKIPGVYVPSFYEHKYNPDGTLAEIVPFHGAPRTVTKRIVEDLDKAYYPTKMIVASTEIVHDRANLELFRGCVRGCRFCQAGFSCRPVRKKSPEVLYRQAVETLEDSGHNEITLSSLSTSDYRGLKELTDDMLSYCVDNRINLSVPSLRADNFSRELMMKLRTQRKSGLTFAPEAGTQRLRDVINKNLTEEEILTTCANAFSGGWDHVKLYFMLGLPTETDEDVLGIAELVHKVILTWKEHASNKKRGLRVHVATAYFVPKPHTPFQWEKQITPEEYLRRCHLLKDHFYSKSVEYNYHTPDISRLEAVTARGDRRLGPVIAEAARNGAKLDGWDEYFNYQIWMDAFKTCGVDPDYYTIRGFGEDELLPWDPIDVGVSKKFLLRERKRAYEGIITPDCRHGCSGCGANGLLQEVECDA
ncbi:MAG TPA: TIGR03960 family B12-binding radical SAM protein [Candidatus Faecousia excrementigallinarum]|uniref:TIGR03960 family B12-binding radical SAM protein n=1 Tax=Candidatus Faecousia excrementigallinarum TaxID=2840806 RepID=A0A9D1CM17_9FIRM|nr:TIGR03960 family B12-binding radical SAM protein [Candidatus Faecousia excrementigallinarum]